MPNHLGKPNTFSIMRQMPLMKLRRTTFEEGHSHTYKMGDKQTSRDNKHFHLIIPGSKITSRAGVNNHTHLLL